MQGSVSDNVIIEEAIRLVNEGVKVTFPVNGRSMLPFIVGGKESVVLEKNGPLRVGHIVLAFVNGDHYVIHRVIAISEETITLMGDGNLQQREYCKLPDVRALATSVVGANKKPRSLNAWWRRAAASLWILLCPFRKYLLFLFRKLYRV